MIERNIVDRVPTHAGRIKLTPVAGRPNYFDMERADEPTVEGTPLDKATFNSIIQSRLTGRYYNVIPMLTLKNSTGGTTTPLPTSGWTLNGVANASSGIYAVYASSAINSTYSVEKAVDGKDDTNWGSLDGTQHTFTIVFPIAIKIKKIGLNMGRTGNTTNYSMSVQGSNNGESWTTLNTFTTFPDNMTEFSLSENVGDYSQYRLLFNKPDGARVYIDTLTIPEWEANSYSIDFVSSEMPIDWSIGQRVTIQVPTYAAFVVDGNTFNGIKVNTVLLSGRKYELTYNG
jgi:hypothetical protein